VIYLDVAIEIPAAEPCEEAPKNIRSPFEGVDKFPPWEVQASSTSVTV
jgi:hypothetical protein